MSSSSTDTGLVDVVMPQMGVSVSEGTIVAWRKATGDRVEYEEPICEISTDKIDSDVPSPAAGRVAEILVAEGSTVDIGTVLARIATGDDGQTAVAPDGPDDAETQTQQPPGEAAAETGETPAPATPEPASQRTAGARSDTPAPADRDSGDSPGRRVYSPVVLRIAAEHDVDLSQIRGTGRGGRVRKQDVLASLEDGGRAEAAAPEPPLHIESPYRPEPAPPRPAHEPEREPERGPATAESRGRRVPLSRMRKAIGEHMLRSLQTAAHCTTFAECDMSGVERRRHEIGTTYLPIVARCTVEALQELPALNAWLEDGVLTQHDAVHLGIAVSLGDDGLIVPVVRDAQDLSDEGLARRIADLAERARARTLVPDEVRDATFTITNPGAFGTFAATPIINQPQVGILDLEAVVKRPVVVTDPRGEDAIAIRPMTMLCLSWDHRALDGVYAARFLATLRRRLESV